MLLSTHCLGYILFRDCNNRECFSIKYSYNILRDSFLSSVQLSILYIMSSVSMVSPQLKISPPKRTKIRSRDILTHNLPFPTVFGMCPLTDNIMKMYPMWPFDMLETTLRLKLLRARICTQFYKIATFYNIKITVNVQKHSNC